MVKFVLINSNELLSYSEDDRLFERVSAVFSDVNVRTWDFLEW